MKCKKSNLSADIFVERIQTNSVNNGKFGNGIVERNCVAHMYVTVRQDRQTSTITYAPSVHTTHIFGSFSIEDNNDQVKKVFLLESSNECRSRRTPRNGGN